MDGSCNGLPEGTDPGTKEKLYVIVVVESLLFAPSIVPFLLLERGRLGTSGCHVENDPLM